ncbi:hypothetical protein RPC_0313 [Rhodopseudomonas palustris BisB18]|uniref:Uncharacterized protein n=1 Tax=Rhodopseudomonas palustris (strain BisB18) TaxID=316056 RepID=Q21CJ8_RHOPB
MTVDTTDYQPNGRHPEEPGVAQRSRASRRMGCKRCGAAPTRGRILRGSRETRERPRMTALFWWRARRATRRDHVARSRNGRAALLRTPVTIDTTDYQPNGRHPEEPGVAQRRRASRRMGCKDWWPHPSRLARAPQDDGVVLAESARATRA